MAFYYCNLLPVISDSKISIPRKDELFYYGCPNDCGEYDEYKVTLTEKGKEEYKNNLVKNGLSERPEIIDKIISSTYSLKIYKDKIIEIRADLVDIKSEEEKFVHDIFMSIYTAIKSIIHNHLFPNLEKGVYITYRSLFSWDDVPKNNTELIKFLKDGLNVMWVENATINKSKDNKTINITDKNDCSNKITINLNKTEKKAILEIAGGERYEYALKEENGRMDIAPIQNIRKEIYKKYIKIKERTFELHLLKNTKERQVVSGLMTGDLRLYLEVYFLLSKKIANSKNLIGTFAYLESIIDGFEKNIKKDHKTDVVKTWISKLQDIQNGIKFAYQLSALLFVCLVAIADHMASIIEPVSYITDTNLFYICIFFIFGAFIFIYIKVIFSPLFNSIVGEEMKAIFNVKNVEIKHDL